MDLMQKVTGFCEIRGREVEILMVKMKKARQKQAVSTPVRCHCSGDCPRTSFCRFVNPLTTRLPVNLTGSGNGEAEAS